MTNERTVSRELWFLVPIGCEKKLEVRAKAIFHDSFDEDEFDDVIIGPSAFTSRELAEACLSQSRYLKRTYEPICYAVETGLVDLLNLMSEINAYILLDSDRLGGTFEYRRITEYIREILNP